MKTTCGTGSFFGVATPILISEGI
ncbi:hypothetical protein OOU_Y34scaffold00395g3 [Pyricularia oryzae Y34]|uniref:Uncharacterized protein n=2 Tax=Pyricularia oryzae TaxID=318829 RepID=A0AA97P2B4_PYRO3|nr:hypothetical protein OOU_Y34scaffold00395g3 [Pyricularia oryzae Y34]